jgi:hypothetical protein
MRSNLRAAVLAVSMFALGWAIPGCGSERGGETGKMESGKMESGKMEGEKK